MFSEPHLVAYNAGISLQSFRSSFGFVGLLMVHMQLLREKGVTFFRELRGELGDFRDRDGKATEPDHVIYLVSVVWKPTVCLFARTDVRCFGFLCVFSITVALNLFSTRERDIVR